MDKKFFTLKEFSNGKGKFGINTRQLNKTRLKRKEFPL